MSKILDFVIFILMFYLLFLTLNYAEYFNLYRHGVDLSYERLMLLLLYSVVLVSHFYSEKQVGFLPLPDSIFLFLITMLIVPGVIFSTNSVLDMSVRYLYVFSIVLFIIGTNISKLSFPNVKLKSCVHKKRNSTETIPDLSISFFKILAIIFIITYIYSGNFNRAGSISTILSLVMGDNSAVGGVNQYRTEIYGNFGVLQLIGNYIGSCFLPIVTSIFMVESKRRKSKSLNLWFISLLVITVVFNLGTGSRMMLLRTILFFGIVYLMISPIRIKSLIRFACVGFIILTIGTSLLGRGVQSDSFGPNIVLSIEKSIARVTLGKGGTSLFVYEYYPEYGSFENGKTILNKIKGSSGDSTQSLAEKMFAFKTSGKVGTAGPQAFGDLYANFGFPGQLVLSLLLGLLFGVLSIFILSMKHWSSVDVAFVSFISLCFGYMGYSELLAFKSIGLFPTLFFYFSYNMLIKKINRNNSSNHFS